MPNTRFPIHIKTADNSVYTGAGSTVKAYKAGTSEFVKAAVKNTDDDGIYYFEDMVTGIYDIKVNNLYQKELRNIFIPGVDLLYWRGIRENQYFVDPEAVNEYNCFTTIQAAIDAIPNYGTGYINLAPTSYYESIVIQNKNVFFSAMPNPLSPMARWGTAYLCGDLDDMTKPTITIDHTDHINSARKYVISFRGLGVMRKKNDGVAGNVFSENTAVLLFKNQGADGLSGGGTPSYWDHVEFFHCNLRLQTWYTQQAAYAMRFYGSGFRAIFDNCHIGIGDHVSSGVSNFEDRGWYKWFLSAEDTRGSQQNSKHSLSAIILNKSFIQLGKVLNIRKPNYGTLSGEKAIELKGSSSTRTVHLFSMNNMFDIMNDKIADVSNNGNAHPELDMLNGWGSQQDIFNAAYC